MVEARGGRRFAVFFFVLAFLVLLLGRWLAPVNHAALSLAAPFVSVIDGAASGIGDAVSGVVDGPRLRSENMMLQRQVGILLRRNVILQQDAHENAILRRMLRFDDRNSHMDLVTARNIGDCANGSVERCILINRGRRDGLRDGMTVLDQSGAFVGMISDLTNNAAKVLLLTSPSLSVGAVDIRSHAGGVVEGRFSGRPQLHYVLSSSSLQSGDWVVTSGQYNLFPRNILIGQIVGVQRSDVKMFQGADIQAAADLQNLELVQVARNWVPAVPAQLLNGH